ncbi:hypothetical protein [Flavobacterium chryseum]|uniref:hypothetical protein n=1 Tax=Flavobacterium sp. P3160 TaxID=2512113 RepID=UPI00105EF2A8|nr:hypothetical protein [Flavobacterium sp. P3160]
METDLQKIHIFKTDITKIDSNCPMQETLNKHSDILQWSVDCEDVDRVLRVVSEKLNPNAIISLVTDFGYQCQELP